MAWHTPGGLGSPPLTSPDYNTRAGFYGVNGIPDVWFNGVQHSVGGYPNGNWEPMYTQFQTIYNNLAGQDTPFSFVLGGTIEGNSVLYEVSLDIAEPIDTTNLAVNIFAFEDNINAYWSGAGQYHDCRFVMRNWVETTPVTISEAGESQLFINSFNISSAWDADNVGIIVIVQDMNTREVFNADWSYANDLSDDFDEDSVANIDDNCEFTYNPDQSDIDSDGIGDVCDPCDNYNVFIPGNLNGDVAGESDHPILDIFDVLALSDYVSDGTSLEFCAAQTPDFNSSGNVDILDIVQLADFVAQNGE